MKKMLLIGSNSYIGIKFAQFIEIYEKSHISVNKISASDGGWRYINFADYDVILLLAGIVHHKERKKYKDLFYQINYKMAVEIAMKAKESNVKQFIFMSTAAVYGNRNERITKDMVPMPNTYYGCSKLAAEKEIINMQSKNFNVVIVRPPMVYGEGCKGNYPKLVKLASILPIIPNVHNKRSVINIDKLCKFLYNLISNDKRGYYHPQDEDYMDTCEFILKTRKKMRKKTWRVRYFDKTILYLSTRLKLFNKMFGNFYYDKDLK